jgi:hypothetical protein
LNAVATVDSNSMVESSKLKVATPTRDATVMKQDTKYILRLKIDNKPSDTDSVIVGLCIF